VTSAAGGGWLAALDPVLTVTVSLGLPALVTLAWLVFRRK